MSEWIKVDSYKDMPPTGEYLVLLEEKSAGCIHAVARRHPNVTFIGGLMSYDAPRVVAYRELEPPVDIQPTVWERTILLALHWIEQKNHEQARDVLNNAATQIRKVHGTQPANHV